MSEAPKWEPDRDSFIPDQQPMSTADNVALIGLCLAGAAALKGVEMVNRVVDQVQSKKAQLDASPVWNSVKRDIGGLRRAVGKELIKAIDPFYH